MEQRLPTREEVVADSLAEETLLTEKVVNLWELLSLLLSEEYLFGDKPTRPRFSLSAIDVELDEVVAKPLFFKGIEVIAISVAYRINAFSECCLETALIGEDGCLLEAEELGYIDPIRHDSIQDLVDHLEVLKLTLVHQ